MTVLFRLVLVAVVAVTALLALVAVNAVRDWEQHTNLRNDSATGELGGEASLPLFVGAQAERRLTAVYLASPTASHKEALEEQRTATDKGIESFRHLSGSELQAEHRHKWAFVERVYKQLDRLEKVRHQADDRAGSPDAITGYYTHLIVKMIEFYQELSAMDDPQLTLETRPLVGLFWASDGLAQEDMLIAEARASGRMTAGHRIAFAQAYGTQRVMYQRWIAPYLPAKDKAAYARILGSEAWKTKERLEKAVINAPTLDGSGAIQELPAGLDRWDAASQKVSRQIAQLNLSRTQGLLAHGYQRAAEVGTQVMWQVGASLAAVVLIAALIAWIIVPVMRRINTLRAAALEARERLPVVVDRLQKGERVDIDREFPVSPGRLDEFGALETAMAGAHRAALEQAAAQAGDRQGFAAFVGATASRSMNVVEKQLELLHGLEKKYGENTVALEEFFELDNTGVRARRHLDNLLALAEVGHAQPYLRPRALNTLVQDAAGETEGYKRVDNEISHRHGVKPQVTSIAVVRGIALHIEDFGSGMTPEQYQEANTRLAQPPTFYDMAQSGDGRLGLIVAGRLAARHGFRVELRQTVYQGTLGVVMLPNELLVSPGDLEAAHTSQREAAPSTPRGQAAAAKSPLQKTAPAPAGLPRRRPQPDTTAPESPAATGQAPGSPPETAPGAPPLPQRVPHAHLVPSLTRTPPPALPYTPEADAAADQAAQALGAFQRGSQAADSHLENKEEPR
ncbi:nitrate- and nitrite sensing domain-containing protein [Streptomyces sp. DSM 41524]|uniref:histidine kinase n=1 Tax=Streptomyces asiaticus subsp. ignotus TaxID=3098222 RepID=A0ABU7QAG1_9ACTN|nr:nitrate- and nitrite sensing domain-containing protein [Streptomyces sp. DSM 41524]